MPLTKSEIIQPTRKRIQILSELVDNNRQIRAREYERNRRKITQYELLQDVQKPIINVIKGLLEDVNSWDIHKLADGRVSWAKLKWTNISPLLQQLNRMSRTEAVETLNDTKNKIPNAYTQQLDIIDRLARLYAEKPQSDGPVSITDLDKVGVLAPIAAQPPPLGQTTGYPLGQYAPLGEQVLAPGEGDEEFGTPTDTPRGSPLRPPDFAGTSAPPPRSLYPLQTDDPVWAERTGESSGVDITHRQHMAQPPPPIPDDTPAVPGQHAREAGLEDTAHAYATLYRDRPEVLKYAADILELGEEKSEYILQQADKLAASGEQIHPTDQLSTIIADVAEVLKEVHSPDPSVQRTARNKISNFAQAMALASDVSTKHPPMVKESFIERFSTIGSPRRARLIAPSREPPLPYRVDPRQALRGLVDPVRTGEQPFRAGMPVISDAYPPGAGVAASPPIRTGSHRPPIGSPVATEPGTLSSEELRTVPGISAEDTTLMTIPTEELTERNIPDIGRTVYSTEDRGDSTIRRTPMGKIKIFGQVLDIHDLTPQSVMVGNKRLTMTPNVWKVLAVKDPRTIQHLDLTAKDASTLNKIASKMGYDEWNDRDPKFKAVARNVLLGRDPELSAREPAHDPADFEAELAQTRRSLARRKIPGSLTRGRKPPVAEEGEDLEDIIPQQWSQTGFQGQWSQTGFQGSGINKKWNPLKLDDKGGLGEVIVSLPDLLERMELVVKRKVGGKVMLRRKGVPIDLIRLLTRRFNPTLKYSDEAKELYKKVVGLSKIPLGKTYSQKENLIGAGVKIQTPTPSLSTFEKTIANAEPDRVMDKLLTDLGTFRNGNRSKMLINDLSLESDFLLERDLIGKEEHELIHKLITTKGKKLSPELKEFLEELFNV